MPGEDEQAAVALYREQVAGLDAGDVVAWAWETFGPGVAQASSLGLEDQAITHLVAQRAPEMPVFTLDTGRLHQETYELLARTEARYGIRTRVYAPDATDVEEMTARHGIDLYRRSVELRKLCCETRKVLPLQRALEGLDAWVCGLRAGQSVTRAGLSVVEWDEAHGLVRVSPLAQWGRDDVRAFIEDNDVPYHPLHDEGYPSIGCAPCTRAVSDGEDERAGRWWWESPEHKECGLHSRPAAPEGR